MKPRSRRNVGMAVVVFVLVVAGIVWASRVRRTGVAPQPVDLNTRLLGEARLTATPVTTYTVEYRSISQELTLTGSIRSPRTANVSAQAPGQVQAVYVSEGDVVTAGQALAQLNPTQAQAQASQARQQVQAAESAYRKALSARQLAAQQAAGDVRTAEIGLREALAGQAKAIAGAGAPAISQAKASARQAHAASSEAAAALKRTRFLFEHDVVSASTLDDVRTKAVQAQAGADAADAGVQQAIQGATQPDRELAAAKVAQAREGLAQAEQSVANREAIANSDVQAAYTQVGSARDQLRVANLALMSTRITSPISGVVSAVQTHAGDAAMPGNPMFVITSLGDVFFDTAVSEAQKLQLAAGQPAAISLEALPGRSFTGRVTAVVPVQNPGSTGFEVRIGITPVPGTIIPPGAYARATVRTGYSPRSLVVPVQGVLSYSPITGQRPDESTMQKYVYVVKDSTQSPTGKMAEQQPIVTGLTTPDNIEVVSGLTAGDVVVTGGAELLQGKPTSPVTVETGSSTT